VSFRCGCGREISELVCPGCRAVYELRAGWRAIRCECGAATFAAPGQVGTSIPCPSCFLRVTVGPDAPPAPPLLKTPPRRTSTPSAPRERLRWLFTLTLLPLALYTFTPRTDPPLKETVLRAEEENPRFRERKGSIGSLDELFRALEIEKLDGALHSRFATAHWLYAIAAAAGFWGLIVGLFPLGRASSLHLWTVGLLIGTAGIVLLLGLHQLPFVKALYEAASGRDGFFTSLVGYTLGIGVCEELVKLLPLAIVFRKAGNLDVRGAAAWGLAMGAGFGVSEAVYYAGEIYNGLLPGDVYVVRFVSCVALHMSWSGAAAVWLWDYRDELEAGERPFAGFMLPMVLASAGSIALHGLYDGLQKFGGSFGALCAAGLSFTYFFWSADRKLAAEKAAPTGPLSA
jgi:RsiW-degrading membrane proteinase PrsW (M82 family)